MMSQQSALFGRTPTPRHQDLASLSEELACFDTFGKSTQTLETTAADGLTKVPTYVNEFWTSRQRAANKLHEISYRACFKPHLPRFFIERLTDVGDGVYDPFMGRGTTIIESALLGRVPSGNDINPLSRTLTEPRLSPPENEEVEQRLSEYRLSTKIEVPEDLLVFYHPQTLREICILRRELLRRETEGQLDAIDRWIQMVAVNRLTGHSPGFFSVYTMPPNQAVSAKAQWKINLKRGQTPPRRDVVALIAKKTRSLLADCGEVERTHLSSVARSAQLTIGDSSAAFAIPDESISLVVTSPPFLDVVQYADDNWLRCWFCGIDAESVSLTVLRRLEDWQQAMTEVFRDMARVLRPGGWAAFEVGEIRGGRIKLEEAVLPCAIAAGLEPVLVLINDQKFTKTANCWGVENNSKGTNSNRVVVIRKPSAA